MNQAMQMLSIMASLSLSIGLFWASRFCKRSIVLSDSAMVDRMMNRMEMMAIT